MTVVYGPEDAIYNTGQYGSARYGSVGPTKQVTGVSSSFSVGSVQTFAKANTVLATNLLTVSSGTLSLTADADTTLSGVGIEAFVGESTVRSVNRVEVTGVSSTFSLGELTAEGGTGASVTLSSLQALLQLGTVTPALKVSVTGLSLVQSIGSVTTTGKATKVLPSQVLTSSAGNTTPNGVRFNFQQFADSYSSQRAVYIPKSNVIPEEA
jgi:hypothetical protein